MPSRAAYSLLVKSLVILATSRAPSTWHVGGSVKDVDCIVQRGGNGRRVGTLACQSLQAVAVGVGTEGSRCVCGLVPSCRRSWRFDSLPGGVARRASPSRRVVRPARPGGRVLCSCGFAMARCVCLGHCGADREGIQLSLTLPRTRGGLRRRAGHRRVLSRENRNASGALTPQRCRSCV